MHIEKDEHECSSLCVLLYKSEVVYFIILRFCNLITVKYKIYLFSTLEGINIFIIIIDMINIIGNRIPINIPAFILSFAF